MSSPHVHDHAHDHTHRRHSHDHGHALHAHPAQPLAWSILRMDVASRLVLAIGVSAALWLMIWLVVR